MADLVEQAQQLADRATPGPWTTTGAKKGPWCGGCGSPQHRDGACYHARVLYANGKRELLSLCTGHMHDEVQPAADAEFIAWCRSGVPALLALVVQLSARLTVGWRIEHEQREALNVAHLEAEAERERLRADNTALRTERDALDAELQVSIQEEL